MSDYSQILYGSRCVRSDSVGSDSVRLDIVRFYKNNTVVHVVLDFVGEIVLQ